MKQELPTRFHEFIYKGCECENQVNFWRDGKTSACVINILTEDYRDAERLDYGAAVRYTRDAARGCTGVKKTKNKKKTL